MSNLVAVARQQSITRESQGNEVFLRATRDGTLFVQDWFQALTLEGRCFEISCGDAARGVAAGTFCGQAAVDTDEFDMLLTCPTNTTVMPYEFNVASSAFGTILTQIVVLAWGATGSLNATNVSVTPANLRTDSPITSACTAGFLGNDAGVAMTIQGIIYYGGYVSVVDGVDDDSGDLAPMVWSAKRTGCAPVLVGPKRVAGWNCATTATGMMRLAYAELPSSAIA